MYNQFFLQGESERRRQRLLWEAEADRLARAGRLRRVAGGGLGKRMMSAFEVVVMGSHRRGSGADAGKLASDSFRLDSSAEPVAHAGSGAASPADRGDLVAR